MKNGTRQYITVLVIIMAGLFGCVGSVWGDVYNTDRSWGYESGWYVIKVTDQQIAHTTKTIIGMPIASQNDDKTYNIYTPAVISAGTFEIKSGSDATYKYKAQLLVGGTQVTEVEGGKRSSYENFSFDNLQSQNASTTLTAKVSDNNGNHRYKYCNISIPVPEHVLLKDGSSAVANTTINFAETYVSEVSTTQTIYLYSFLSTSGNFTCSLGTGTDFTIVSSKMPAKDICAMKPNTGTGDGNTNTLANPGNYYVTVKFNPQTEGDKSDVITISDGHGHTATITVTGKAKHIKMEFAKTKIGQASASQNIDLAGSASSPYSVGEVEGYMFSNNNTNWYKSLSNVTSGSKLYVKFQPTNSSSTTSKEEKEVTITQNSKTKKIKVSGQAEKYTLSATQKIGLAKNYTLTLTNFTAASNATVTVGQKTVSSTTQYLDYFVKGSGSWGTSASVTSGMTLNVKFQPSDATALHDGSITITSDGRNYTFDVDGTGSSHSINKGYAKVLTYAMYGPQSGDWYYFTNKCTNCTKNYDDLSLHSKVKVSFTSNTAGNDFMINNMADGATFKPSATTINYSSSSDCGFRIGFYPTAETNNTQSCTVKIEDDNGNGKTYTFTITYNGVAKNVVDNDNVITASIGQSSEYKFLEMSTFRGFGELANGTATVRSNGEFLFATRSDYYNNSNTAWKTSITITNGAGCCDKNVLNGFYVKYVPTVAKNQGYITLYVDDDTKTTRQYQYYAKVIGTASEKDFTESGTVETVVDSKSSTKDFTMTNFTPKGSLTVTKSANFEVSADGSDFSQSPITVNSSTKKFWVRFAPTAIDPDNTDITETVKMKDITTGREYPLTVKGTPKKKTGTITAQNLTYTTAIVNTPQVVVGVAGSGKPITGDCSETTNLLQFSVADGYSQYLEFNANNELVVKGASATTDDAIVVPVTVLLKDNNRITATEQNITVTISKIDYPTTLAWTSTFKTESNNRSIPVLVRTTSTQTGKMDAANYNTIDLLTKVTYPTGGEVSFSVDATTSSNGSINSDGHTLTIKRGSDVATGNQNYQFPISLNAKLNGTTIYKSKSIQMNFYAGIVNPYPIWTATNNQLKKSDGTNYRYGDEIQLSNYFTHTYRYLPEGESNYVRLSQKQPQSGLYQIPTPPIWSIPENSRIDNATIKVEKAGTISIITILLYQNSDNGMFPYSWKAPMCPRVQCGPTYGVDQANDGQMCINITFDRALNNAQWKNLSEFNVSNTYNVKTDVVTTTRNEDTNTAIDKSNITYNVDDNSIATLSGTTLSFQKAGIIEVSVNDPGDNDYYLGLDDDAEKSRKFIVQPNETWDFGSVAKGSDEVITKTFSNFLIFKSGTTREAWTDDSHFEIKDGITYRYASQSNPATITTSSQIEIKFTPTANGAVNGKLYIKETYNGKGYIFIINLHGSGIGFDPIDFKDQTVDIGHASTTKNIDLASISSATSILVSSDKPTIFRVFNAGQETSQCTATSTLAGQAIDATGKSSVNIKYVPETANTNETGTVTVQYVLNGVSKSYTIEVYGKSQASSLAFGSKQLATFAARQTFTLSNMVTSSNYTITASNPNVFRIDGSSASSVTKNSGQSFTVDFFPLAVASYSETITILDNATSKRYVISASGTATAKSIAFGQVQKGSSSNQSLTISDLPDASSFTTKYSIESSSTAFAVSNASATGATITFTPTQIGAFSGTIYLKDKSSGVLYPLATVSGSCAGTATTEDQYIIWNQDLSSLTGSGSVQLSAISTSGLPVTYEMVSGGGTVSESNGKWYYNYSSCSNNAGCFAVIKATCAGGESSTTLLTYGAADEVQKNVVVYPSAPGASECVLYSVPSSILWKHMSQPCTIGSNIPHVDKYCTYSSNYLIRQTKSDCNTSSYDNYVEYKGSRTPQKMTFKFKHRNLKYCRLTFFANGKPNSDEALNDSHQIYDEQFDFSANESSYATESLTINLSSSNQISNGSKIYCRLTVACAGNYNNARYANDDYKIFDVNFYGSGGTIAATSTTSVTYNQQTVGSSSSKSISAATYDGLGGNITAAIEGDDADCFTISGSNVINAGCNSGTAIYSVNFIPLRTQSSNSSNGSTLKAKLVLRGPKGDSQKVTVNLQGTASKRDLSLNWSYAEGTQIIDAIRDNNTITLATADNPTVTVLPTDLPASVAYYPFTTSNVSPSWLYTDAARQRLVNVTYSTDGKYITKVEATGYGSGTAKITATTNFTGNNVLKALNTSKDLTVIVNKVNAVLELSTNMSSSEYLYFGDLVRTTGAKAYLQKADGTKAIIKDWQNNELFTLANGLITCTDFVNCTDKTSDHSSSLTGNNKAIEISKVNVVPQIKLTINNAVVNSKTETFNLNDNAVKKIPILIKNTLANSQDKMQVYFDEGPIDLLSTVYFLDKRHSATTVSGYDASGNVVYGEGAEAHWQGPFLLPSDGQTYPTVKEEYSLMSAGTFGGNFYKYTSTESLNEDCSGTIGSINMTGSGYKRSAKLTLSETATGIITVTLSTDGVMSYSSQNNTQFYETASKTFQIEVLKRDPALQFTAIPTTIGYGKTYFVKAESTYSIKSAGTVTYSIASGYESYASIDPNTGYLKAKALGPVKVVATITSTGLFNDQTITSEEFQVVKADRGAKWYQDNTKTITLLTNDEDFALPAYTYYSYLWTDGSTKYKRINVSDQGTLTYSLTAGSQYASIATNSHLHIGENIGTIAAAGVTIKVQADFTNATLYNDATSTLTVTLKPENITISGAPTSTLSYGDELSSTTEKFDLLAKLVAAGITTNYPEGKYSFSMQSTDETTAKVVTVGGKQLLTAYKETANGSPLGITITATDKVIGSTATVTVYVAIGKGTLYFNVAGGGKWMDPAKWSREDIVSEKIQTVDNITTVDLSDYNVSVTQNCFIGKDPSTTSPDDKSEWLTHRVNASCHNLSFDGANAKLVIGEASTLRVAGALNNYDNSTTNNQNAAYASRLVLTANKWGQASVVFGEGMPMATVEMFLPAGNGSRTAPVWQYRGIAVDEDFSPITSADVIDNNGNPTGAKINPWSKVQIYRWDERENDNLTRGCWVDGMSGSSVVAGSLDPWVGYAFANMTTDPVWLRYTGTLIRGDHTYTLTKTEADNKQTYDNLGNNLITNSFAAPLTIDQGDYGGANATVTFFNAGSYDQWDKEHSKSSTYEQRNPGRMTVCPKNTGDDAQNIYTIPSGQSFFITANNNGDVVKFEYDDIVAYLAPSGQMFAPRKDKESEFNILGIRVSKDSLTGDRLVLLECDSCSRQYDNGYDGYEMREEADGWPHIYAYNKFGNTAVNADSTFNKQYVGFAAGSDDETYTISFETDRLFGYHSLYLVDRKLNETVDILAGETYSFKGYTVGENTRFQINGMTIEEYENQEKGENDEVADLCDLRVVGNTLFVEGFTAEHYKAANIEIFDMTGNMVWSTALTDSRVYDLPALPHGVYTVRLGDCHVKYGVR